MYWLAIVVNRDGLWIARNKQGPKTGSEHMKPSGTLISLLAHQYADKQGKKGVKPSAFALARQHSTSHASSGPCDKLLHMSWSGTRCVSYTSSINPLMSEGLTWVWRHSSVGFEGCPYSGAEGARDAVAVDEAFRPGGELAGPTHDGLFDVLCVSIAGCCKPTFELVPVVCAMRGRSAHFILQRHEVVTTVISVLTKTDNMAFRCIGIAGKLA